MLKVRDGTVATNGQPPEPGVHRFSMKLTNDSYVILIGTKNFTERYYRDKKGWLKISARGRKFRMTAEQVLNHLLPAIAGVKPNVIVKVEHHDAPVSGLCL
jgi:hypothetical protein